MRYRLSLVTAPASEPVTVAEAKTHMRVDSSADDTYIGTLITAARIEAEAFTHCAFITQTHKMLFDAFPGATLGGADLSWWDGMREGALSTVTRAQSSITIPLAPLVSVTSIKSYGIDDTSTTMSSSAYQVSTYSGPVPGNGRVTLRDGEVWPTNTLRLADGAEILFVAGYGSSGSDVPAPIRQAILCAVSELYENRGDCAGELPTIAKRLLQPFRLERVALW